MKPSVRGAGRRKAAAVSLAAAALLLVPGPAPARADVPGRTEAFCHIDVPQVTVTPGFSSVPVRGTGASGEGANIRCLGTIDGHQVLGDPGPLSVTFDYGTGPLSSVTQGDTCLIGSGDGVVSATVTAVDGTAIDLTGPIHFSFVGPLATFYGHFGTRAYAGLGEPIPDLSTIQDCLVTPITRFSIRGQMALKDV